MKIENLEEPNQRPTTAQMVRNLKGQIERKTRILSSHLKNEVNVIITA